MTIYFRTIYILTSLCPLFFLLFVASYSTNKGLACVSALLGLVSFFLFMSLNFKKGNKDFREIETSKNASENIFSYILSILPTIILNDFGSIQTLLNLGSLYFIIIIILVKSEVMILNPLFILFGYKIYIVKFKNFSNEAFIIAKKSVSLSPGRKVSVWEVQRPGVFYLE